MRSASRLDQKLFLEGAFLARLDSLVRLFNACLDAHDSENRGRGAAEHEDREEDHPCRGVDYDLLVLRREAQCKGEGNCASQLSVDHYQLMLERDLVTLLLRRGDDQRCQGRHVDDAAQDSEHDGQDREFPAIVLVEQDHVLSNHGELPRASGQLSLASKLSGIISNTSGYLRWSCLRAMPADG